MPQQAVRVSRERVLAPADRFLDVEEEALVRFFQGLLPVHEGQRVAALQQLVEMICSQENLELRRSLGEGFGFFACAAAGKPSRERFGSWDELDAQEQAFLGDLCQALQAGHYRMLGRQEWEGAVKEDFMLTLPVCVDYGAMDSRLLRRFWAARERGEREREAAPPELADRCLVFYRGVDVAQMHGDFYRLKAEYLVNFLLVQPALRAASALLHLFGLARTALQPPPGVFPEKEGSAAPPEEQPRPEVRRLRRHSMTIERRTFARVFPNGRAVLEQLLRKVSLQEACFRDVVVLYRRRVAGPSGGEEQPQLVEGAGPAFLARNMHLRHFKRIPLADMELVLPEKRVFVPPTVLLQLLVTLGLGVAAVLGLLRQGKLKPSVLWSTLLVMATHALEIYHTTQSELASLEQQMSAMLYNHTAASQEAVLHTLADELNKQRSRELYLCYCVLLASGPMTEAALDAACEKLLEEQFGLVIDFTAEQALPRLVEWGLAEAAQGPDGMIQAVPIAAAQQQLERVWGSLLQQPDVLGGGTGSEAASLARPPPRHQCRWQWQPPRPLLQGATGAPRWRQPPGRPGWLRPCIQLMPRHGRTYLSLRP